MLLSLSCSLAMQLARLLTCNYQQPESVLIAVTEPYLYLKDEGAVYFTHEANETMR